MESPQSPVIRSVVVSPFQVNCWLIACPATGETAVIDSGDDVPDILTALGALEKESGRPLSVRYLLHTHAHLDHFGGTRALFNALSKQGQVPLLVLHPADEALWNELRSQGRMFGLDYEVPLPLTRLLKDGEDLPLGEFVMTVIHMPGHSPGGTCFHVHPKTAASAGGRQQEVLFSGDTLFQGSIGRTDLWGGDHATLIRSIREKLWKLPDSTRVCCGHGPDTTIGTEKRENPFVQ